MAQEKPNRLVEWYLLVRRQVPIVRQHLVDWCEAVREEPSLLWHTAGFRYAVYLVSGIILVTMVGWAAQAIAPPTPVGAQAEAVTADFHAVCTNPSCGTHFAVRERFGFDDFPVRCPTCERETGFAARPCASATCTGRWVVPIQVEGVVRCPECDTPFH